MPAGAKREIADTRVPEYSRRILALRGGLRQAEFARQLGVSAMAVSHWEKGTNEPGSKMYMKLAQRAEGELREWFTQRGMSDAVNIALQVLAPVASPSLGMRQIPILRDSAAAGTPRAVEATEIDYTLLFPPALLPAGGKLIGFKIEGESMKPLLETGFIVLVDTSQRDMAKLAGRMVAARDEDGVTIKWLRKQGKVYLLVPQNTSLRNEVRIITDDHEIEIVGEVVKWIGGPYIEKKRK